MIPKIIHYCWFGGNPLPKSVIKCINSWKKYFPDYEIKEWNESNFDVNLMSFTREAYSVKKYAFVSDVARFWILYHEGGLYFDTDVEVVASFDNILQKGAFMGVETPSDGINMPTVNPGLGLGCEAKNLVWKSIINYYMTLHYQDINGQKIPGTVVTHTTKVLVEQYGLKPNNEIQKLDGVTIYPVDFFNPFNDLTGVLKKTRNTRSIHWFSKTWIDRPMWYFRITRVLHLVFGIRMLEKVKHAFGMN